MMVKAVNAIDPSQAGKRRACQDVRIDATWVQGWEVRTSSSPRGPARPLALKHSLVMTVSVLAAWRMPAYNGIHDLRTGSS